MNIVMLFSRKTLMGFGGKIKQKASTNRFDPSSCRNCLTLGKNDLLNAGIWRRRNTSRRSIFVLKNNEKLMLRKYHSVTRTFHLFLPLSAYGSLRTNPACYTSFRPSRSSASFNCIVSTMFRPSFDTIFCDLALFHSRFLAYYFIRFGSF